MPKKKQGKPIAKILLVIVVIAVITIGVISWHDGLFGLTSINDINDGLVPVGTNVAIKGEVTLRVGNILTISDGPNFVFVQWEGSSTLHSIVVVRGNVATIASLENVTSLDVVWFFSDY